MSVHLRCSTELGGSARVPVELCVRNPDCPRTRGPASWNRQRSAFLSAATQCMKASTLSGHDSGNLRSVVTHTHTQISYGWSRKLVFKQLIIIYLRAAVPCLSHQDKRGVEFDQIISFVLGKH